MIILLIFLIHLVFLISVLVKKTKKEKFSSGLIDAALIIILFSVGWSLSAMFTKLIWEPEGFGKYFDRDTITLTILTIIEFFFYRFYYRDLFFTSNGKEK